MGRAEFGSGCDQKNLPIGRAESGPKFGSDYCVQRLLFWA